MAGVRNDKKPVTRVGRPKGSGKRQQQHAGYAQPKKREALKKVKDETSDVIDASKIPTKHDGRGEHNRKKLNYTSPFKQEDLEALPIYAPMSVKQEKYLNDEKHDVVVWGGAAAAGKTQLSLLRILLAGLSDPDYVAAIARKSQRQMKQAGSLWSSGSKMYGQFGVIQNKIEMTWNFPKGAEIKCHHLDKNQDDWQGVQATEFLVDEAQQCLEDDVWYLTSRLRSQSDRKHQLRMTCNPLNTSFLCKWLQKAGYLTEDGLPDPERDGKTTYMLELDGDFKFFKTRKEIEELYGKDIASFASSFVFYSATVYDNPWIRKHQPAYVHKLENLRKLERERLLLGNWFAKLESEGYVKREWFNECNFSDVPIGAPTIRAYDLASSPVSPAYRDPDWTRGVKATYDMESGQLYIIDMVSIRDRPAKVQELIEGTAERDGKDVYVGIPIDAGQAGREVADNKRSRLVARGFKPILCPTRKSKLQRAEPFLMALQQGKVSVVPGVFEDIHYEELENFTGMRSPWHDDIMDTLAECWTQLTTGKLIPTVKFNKHMKAAKNIGGSTLL